MTPQSETDRPLERGCWAQDYAIESGQTHYHELSHTRVWVTLLDQEWQLRHQSIPDSEDQNEWNQRIAWNLPGSDVPVQRFVRPDAGNNVRYLPVMADKPTVVRPYQPLTLPPHTECTIYVGTLVTMAVQVGDAGTTLMELPLAQPALTWLGRNTMEGDLCYAAATYARLVLEAVPKRPWRAITPVTIINRRSEPLLLERFSLPTPLLALYRNERDQLWTPKVTITCDTDMASARLKVDSGTVEAAGDCTLVTAAREQPARGTFVRAFDRMFG